MERARLSVVSRIRAYVRYGDGSWGRPLRDLAEARWEFIETLNAERISVGEALRMTVDLIEGGLVDGDLVSEAYIRAYIDEKAARMLKDGPLVPVLLFIGSPTKEKKVPKVVDLEPGHFGPRRGSQN